MSVLRIVQSREMPGQPACWIVIDLRAKCPRCGKWPAAVSTRSKKQARKAMVRHRGRGCPCTREAA